MAVNNVAAPGHMQAGLPSGPLAQTVATGFGVLRVATAIAAALWATANMRPVPPGYQAVVLRFGAVVRVQQAGLVLALPRPIENKIILPGPDAQMTLKIHAGTARVAGIVDDVTMPDDVPDDAGLYLTGDNGVVLLDAGITWHITDAAAYYLAQAHVPQALRRAFLNAAVAVTAARPLDDFMAVRPERAADPAAQAARSAVRGDLVTAMNRALTALAAAGTPLGVEVTRADVTALLPPAAKNSFDAVLDATQRAEQGLATARTEATRTRQQADREQDSLLTNARASAEERIGRARSTTAAIAALEEKESPATRGALMQNLYRERIGPILAAAASTQVIDPKAASRILLPGPP